MLIILGVICIWLFIAGIGRALGACEGAECFLVAAGMIGMVCLCFLGIFLIGSGLGALA